MEKEYLFVIVWESQGPDKSSTIKTSFNETFKTTPNLLASEFKKFINSTHEDLGDDTGNQIIFTDVIG